MATSETSNKKPPLTQGGLRKHGVEYDDRLLETNDYLPEHVDAARDALLDFNGRIPHEWRHALELDLRSVDAATRGDDPDELHSAWSPLPELETSYWKLEELADEEDRKYYSELKDTVTHSRRTTKDFISLAYDAEAAWTFTLIAKIFHRDSHGTMNGQRKIQIFKQWRLEEDVIWSAQPSIETPPDASPLSTPKPDLTYAYPLFRPMDNVPSFFSKVDWLKSLSAGFIQDLYRKGLKCTLSNQLLNAKSGSAPYAKLEKHHLMGFPWEVVQVKRENIPDATEEFCFNQAANATAAAVRMYKTLVDFCEGTKPSDIPPIVGYTCIGPKVKVWLTYFDDAKGKIRMACIWSANLKTIWGVLSIRLIVENMHGWASTILSMKLNVLLELIRRSLDHTPLPAERDQREEDSPSGQSHVQDTVNNVSATRESSSSCQSCNDQSVDLSGGSLQGHLLSTPPASTRSGASSQAEVATGAGVNEASHTAPDHHLAVQAGATRYEISPGHDSGIESDIDVTPAQAGSASTRRYEQKTGFDARNAVQQQASRPAKVAWTRLMARTGPTVAPGNDQTVHDQANPTAGPGSESSDDVFAPLPPAAPIRVASGTQKEALTTGLVDHADGTTEEAEHAEMTRPPRPAAARLMSEKFNKLRESGQAAAGDLRDRYDKTVNPLGLSGMLAAEASRQRNSQEGTSLYPTLMTDSPIHTPLQNVPENEQHDTSSPRPSLSGRLSFPHRRSSSKVLQSSALQRTPSKPETDASSEISATSSRLETLGEVAH